MDLFHLSPLDIQTLSGRIRLSEHQCYLGVRLPLVFSVGANEVRDPVHGFIAYSDWERDIVNHDAFQRLRRVRQLAWTDIIQGLHIADWSILWALCMSRLECFDTILSKNEQSLLGELKYDSLVKTRFEGVPAI